MPPRAKFTKKEIIDAAMEIVRREGFPALTARALGDRLGSSARPIFTVFRNMEEVQQSVMGAAKELYAGYVEKGLGEELPFKGVGMQYILFAVQEPKLFQLLFMKEKQEIPDLKEILPLIDENYKKIHFSLKEGYGLADSEAERLYHHLWIYTHGIASLCATSMCRFTGDELSGMLTEVFISLINTIREENKQ